MRVSGAERCGAQSPETSTGCRLEPGHDGKHVGFHPEPAGKVLWVDELAPLGTEDGTG
jgi:hypothetical protein